jgi:hypothetical protein
MQHRSQPRISRFPTYLPEELQDGGAVLQGGWKRHCQGLHKAVFLP